MRTPHLWKCEMLIINEKKDIGWHFIDSLYLISRLGKLLRSANLYRALRIRDQWVAPLDLGDMFCFGSK